MAEGVLAGWGWWVRLAASSWHWADAMRARLALARLGSAAGWSGSGPDCFRVLKRAKNHAPRPKDQCVRQSQALQKLQGKNEICNYFFNYFHMIFQIF